MACGTVWVLKLLTDLLVLRDAHDLHGLQSLSEEVLVMLARDGQVAVGNKAVVVVALQTQLG